MTHLPSQSCRQLERICDECVCLPCLLTYVHPFLANSIVDLLSWYKRLLSIVQPCDSMKYFHHIITPRTSVILTNSYSVELPTLSLCLLDTFTIAPLPMDTMAPLWIPINPIRMSHQPTTSNWWDCSHLNGASYVASTSSNACNASTSSNHSCRGSSPF